MSANNSRGSVMIAALILTLILGSLVGLFLQTVSQEVTYTNRSRMAIQAVNIAEAGLEYGLDAMMQNNWSGWTKGSNGYYRESFPYVSFNSGGAVTKAKVYFEPGNDPPRAVAEGIITHSNGTVVTKQVYIEMKPGTNDPTKGGFWGNGITGKKSLDFGGNKQAVDSFSSSAAAGSTIVDIYNAQVRTTILGHTLANGRGSVASLSVQVTDISIGNADIFGSLATGAAGGTDISGIIGPNGHMYNHNTQHGDETFDGQVDHAYIAYDFYSDLPDPVAPTMNAPITSISGGKIGTTGTSTEYKISSLSMKTKDTYTVNGDVVMIIDGNMTVGGTINLAPGATLQLYVKGNIDIGGNGLVNSGKPADLQIFNTGKGTSVKLHGNGFLSAAVYAPNSDVSLRGGGNSGEMFGAVVGNSVTFSGNNYWFHYDEDLADLGDDEEPDDGDYVPEVVRWVELTDAAERRNMATILSDGL